MFISQISKDYDCNKSYNVPEILTWIMKIDLLFRLISCLIHDHIKNSACSCYTIFWDSDLFWPELWNDTLFSEMQKWKGANFSFKFNYVLNTSLLKAF